MIRFILKRLVQAIPLLLGIATITFFIVQLAPGDPMDFFIEKNFQMEVDPEVIELIRQKYGLDQPLHVQYVKWLGNLLQGDLGEFGSFNSPCVSFEARRRIDAKTACSVA